MPRSSAGQRCRVKPSLLRSELARYSRRSWACYVTAHAPFSELRHLGRLPSCGNYRAASDHATRQVVAFHDLTVHLHAVSVISIPHIFTEHASCIDIKLA